jgi:polysaccharide biosynthesis protein PslG
MELGIGVPEAALLSAADLEKTFAAAVTAGFKRVRVEIDWLAVQPTKTTWNWAGAVAALQSAQKHGLTILPTLGVHPPSWAYTAADFGAFCGAAAKALGLPEYEIWNEPNLDGFWAGGGGASFAPYQIAANTAIKKALPNAKVFTPGLAAAITYSGWEVTKLWGWLPWIKSFTNSSPVDWLNAYYGVAGARGSFDAVCYHPYSLDGAFNPVAPIAGSVMLANTAALQTVMITHSDLKPVIHTEWGFDSAKVPPATAATWFTTQWAILSAQAGVARSYLFSLRDYAGETNGILDANWNPKQPYYNTVVAAAKLANA